MYEPTLYVFGDLAMFRTALQALAMIFGHPYWEPGGGALLGMLPGIATLVTLIAIGITGILKRDLRLDVLLVLIIIYTVLFVPKTRVFLEDVYSGTVAVVDDVPFGVAAVGGVINNITYTMTNVIDTVFQAADAEHSAIFENGFASPLRLLLAVRNIKPSTIGTPMQTTIAYYMRYCTRRNSDYHQAQYKIQYLLDNAKPAMTVVYADVNPDGVQKTCAEAATDIQNAITNYIDAAENDGIGFSNHLNAAMTTATGTAHLSMGGVNRWTTASWEAALHSSLDTIGTDAKSFLTDLIFTRFAQSSMECGNQGSDAAFEMCVITTTQALEQQRIDSTSSGSIFQKTVVPMMNGFLFLFYALAPLVTVVMMASGMNGLSIAAKYMLFGVWTQSWLPMVAVINFFMRAQTREELKSFMYSLRNGADNTTHFYDIVATKLQVAGDLLAATPLITLAILSGSMFSLATLANRMGSSDRVDEKTAAPDLLKNQPVVSSGGQNFDHQGLGNFATGSPGQGRVAVLPEAVIANSPKAIAQNEYLQAVAASQADVVTKQNALTDSMNKVADTMAGITTTGTTGDKASSGASSQYTSAVNALNNQIRQFSGQEKWNEKDMAQLGAALSGGIGTGSLLENMKKIPKAGLTTEQRALLQKIIEQSGTETNSDGTTVGESAAHQLVQSAQRVHELGRQEKGEVGEVFREAASNAAEYREALAQEQRVAEQYSDSSKFASRQEINLASAFRGMVAGDRENAAETLMAIQGHVRAAALETYGSQDQEGQQRFLHRFDSLRQAADRALAANGLSDMEMSTGISTLQAVWNMSDGADPRERPAIERMQAHVMSELPTGRQFETGANRAIEQARGEVDSERARARVAGRQARNAGGEVEARGAATRGGAQARVDGAGQTAQQQIYGDAKVGHIVGYSGRENHVTGRLEGSPSKQKFHGDMSNLQRALEYSGIRTVRDTAGQGFQVLDRAGEAFGNTVFEAAGGVNGMVRATQGVAKEVDAHAFNLAAGGLEEMSGELRDWGVEDTAAIDGWAASLREVASGRKAAAQVNFDQMDREVRATENRLRAQYVGEASSRGITDETQRLYYAETRLREMTFAYRAREDTASLSGDRQSGASGSTLHSQLGDRIDPEAKAWIDEVAGGANYGEYGTWSDNAPPMPASMAKGPGGEGLTITITKDARDIAEEEGRRPGPEDSTQ